MRFQLMRGVARPHSVFVNSLNDHEVDGCSSSAHCRQRQWPPCLFSIVRLTRESRDHNNNFILTSFLAMEA